MANDYYAVLGVGRGATLKELKIRFRVLARARHPDRFQGAEKAQAESDFQSITEAFNVLSDPQRRRNHDQDLERPSRDRRNDPQQVGRVYLNRGIKAYRVGNFLEAASNFHNASRADRENPQAWHHLALACVEETRWLDRARDAIERAITLVPRKASYHKLAGKIFAKSGMAGRAKQYYNDALQLGGPDASIRHALEALGGGSPRKPEKTRSGLFKKLW